MIRRSPQAEHTLSTVAISPSHAAPRLEPGVFRGATAVDGLQEGRSAASAITFGSNMGTTSSV
jgi:hypothetical protein